MKFERFVKAMKKYKIVSIEDQENVLGVILCRNNVNVQALIQEYFKLPDSSDAPIDFFSWLDTKIQFITVYTDERAIWEAPIAKVVGEEDAEHTESEEGDQSTD